MEQALHAMGYRQLDGSSIWAKPMGYSLLYFDTKKKQWGQKFYQPTNSSKILTWTTKNWNGDGELLPWLVECENWEYHTVEPTRERKNAAFHTEVIDLNL